MKTCLEYEIAQDKYNNFTCNEIIDNNKKNIVIISNCHGVVICECLKKIIGHLYNIYVIMSFRYRKYDYETYGKEDKKQIINILKNASICIYQLAYKNDSFFSTYKEDDNCMLNYCPKDIQKICFTNLQNTGLWSTYFINENVTDQYILNNFQNSLKYFKNIDSQSDTPIYDIFVNNFQNIKMLIDVAHPTFYIFKIIVLKILEKLNMSHLYNKELDSITCINPCNLMGGWFHTSRDIKIFQLKYVSEDEIIQGDLYVKSLQKNK